MEMVFVLSFRCSMSQIYCMVFLDRLHVLIINVTLFNIARLHAMALSASSNMPWRGWHDTRDYSSDYLRVVEPIPHESHAPTTKATSEWHNLCLLPLSIRSK